MRVKNAPSCVVGRDGCPEYHRMSFLDFINFILSTRCRSQVYLCRHKDVYHFLATMCVFTHLLLTTILNLVIRQMHV